MDDDQRIVRETGAARHFGFGENWASYARLIDEDRLNDAAGGLTRLFGRDALRGTAFLDIGCGSGLHAAAAARLGVARILAIDVDPISVRTAREVLGRFASATPYQVEELSVFDLCPRMLGRFDAVYSWGVLHHTGAMRSALGKAAAMVQTGGLFAFALYAKTPLCPIWAVEKRWYARASEQTQARVQKIYAKTVQLSFALRGRNFDAHVKSYRSDRGMDYRHDVHDWLGGYPYESISSREVATLMEQHGFEEVQSFLVATRYRLFGAGCNEFVYRRKTD
jgi:2-polyprenyl-3-methyl-5-hydroxy-6-metoxy-1,4-benzoquinol methylase